MKRMVSWILTCALLLTLLPAGAWAAEPLKVTPKVDAGKNFCAALDENGTVWTWGQNGNGQLGDGTETDRYYAVPVLEGVVDIDASGSAVMALKADGTLWAWGEGGKYLGVGYDNTDVKEPDEVILPNDSGVKDFFLGYGCSIFLMNDGTVWTWGGTQRYGSETSNRRPYHVYELDNANVTSLSGSDYRDLCIAICGSGTPEDPSEVYFWGDNVYGWCLNEDLTVTVRTPEKVTFPESGYLTDIRAGEGTIFARVGGPEPGVYAWGRNDYCQTGVGEQAGGEEVTTPNKITGYHSSAPLYVTPGWGSGPVAFHEDGTLWTWGYDELLMPPYTGTRIPVLTEPVQIDANHVVEAARGDSHLVALRKDGLVYVRGSNDCGQRGVPEHLGEFDEYEFDFDRPVQKQDGTPLSLRNFDGPVHFLTVKVNAKQGAVTGSAPDAYQEGDMITFTAQAKEGWVFTGWAAEGVTLTDIMSPTISFAMPAGDVTVTALFEKDLNGMTGSGSFQGEVGAPDPDAIPISTAEQLASIGSDYPLDGSYVLAADLDLSGRGSWTPIGSNEAPFTGTFDGQGHVITGLTIGDRMERAGLFGKVDQKGVIKNLGLEQVSITVSGSVDGACYVGGIAGQMGVDQEGYNMGSTAEMHNCYVTGEITAQISRGDLYLGGLAGQLNADVSDCFNTASLSGKAGSTTLESNSLYMGGLTGRIGTYLLDPFVVERCFNEGELTPSTTQNTAYVGGIVGYLSNRVVFRQCCNTVDVWMLPRSVCGRYAYLGGIAGFSDSSIYDCYNLGKVGASESDSAAYYEMACGGIVGYSILGESEMEYEITNCYTADNDIFCAGGLAGWAGETGQSLIRSSYSRTTLTATGRYGSILGGILGTAKGETSGNGGQVLIQNCFNSGAVQIAVNDENSYSVSVFAGGLVGTAQKCTLQIQNSCNRGTVTARERNDGDLESYLSCYAHAGGLVGQNGSASLEIKDCYNSGDVFALEDRTEAYAGGLIGSSNALCTVERSYVSGAVSAESPGDGTSYAGGLEGYNTYAEAAYTDSFVLTGEISAAFANTVCMPGASISNVRVLAPVSGDINNNATGTVTAEEAGRQAAYTAAGWSFDGGTAAWRMKPGSPYPVLSWEPDSLSGRPVLQGQPKVVNLNFPQEGIAPNSGNMLYADVSTLTTDQGEDALGTISYQWMRNDSPIAGATGNTYQIPESGSKRFRYSVRVTASGCAGTAFSEKTMPVEDRLMLLGTVEIDNTDPELLDTLHVDVSGLSVTKGSVEELNLKYEWYLEGDSWKVSTADSYTVRADAVDEAIYVRVTASGAVNYVESAPTQPVRLVDFAGGTGTEGDPYQISNTKEWALFQYRVGYQDHVKYTGAHYELTRDIDFSQAPGNLHISNKSGFAGVLDGNGHAIRNMTIQSVASYGEIGLFSRVTEGGVIKNLHLENANFTGGNNVGGLVGLLQDSTLSNCTVSGTLQTTSTSGVMGGLVCRAENSHISDCRNYASLSGSDNTGGIVGEAANCTLERVYNNADISQTGGYGAGGIVGRLGGGSISQAVNRGAVESEKVYNTGGIVGMVQGGSGSENKEVTLDNCTNLGTVRGNYVSTASAGGLIGAADWPGGTVKITNSINSGRVSTGTVGKIGGMVGEIQSETLIVKNCANTGELTFGTAIGKTKYAGGVVGYVMLSNAVLTVENFYTTGFPTAGGDDPNSGSYEKFGRLYGGMQYNIQKTFTNCYSNADPQSHKDDQEEFYTYAPDMQEEAFADTLSANIAGQEGLLAWQLDQEVNGGYPSLAGQGSRILYAGSRGVELSWSGEASAAETDFVLAAYDTEGRLLAVNTMSLAGSLPDQLFFREPVELGTGCTVNVFSLAPESLAPQRAVLTCIIE